MQTEVQGVFTLGGVCEFIPGLDFRVPLKARRRYLRFIFAQMYGFLSNFWIPIARSYLFRIFSRRYTMEIPRRLFLTFI